MSILNNVMMAKWYTDLQEAEEQAFEEELESIKKNDKTMTPWAFIREWVMRTIDRLCSCHQYRKTACDPEDSDSDSEVF